MLEARNFTSNNYSKYESRPCTFKARRQHINDEDGYGIPLPVLVVQRLLKMICLRRMTAYKDVKNIIY